MSSSLVNGCYSNALPSTIHLASNLTSIVIDTLNAACSPFTGKMTFPPEIGSLSRLETLKIASFELNGSPPDSFGDLVSLRHLMISKPYIAVGSANYATVTIPSSFWRLQELRTIEFDWSNLIRIGKPSSNDSFPLLEHFSFINAPNYQDSLDTFLQGTTKLKRITISGTTFATFSMSLILKQRNLTHLNLAQSNSNIQLSQYFWSSFPEMVELILYSTDTRGSISPEIATMKRLSVLNLSYTKVTGVLPAEIVDCKSLRVLSLLSTRLSHPIPDIFASLSSSLEILQISDMMNGPGLLPPSIGTLTNLQDLQLYRCGFNGTIPSGLAYSKNLTTMVLHNNALTGPLPEYYGTQAVSMDVHNNRLSGTIPKSLANSSASLILSHNELGPDIERDLFWKQTHLVTLMLDHNRFQGPLPRLLVSFVDLSHNEFSGTVPEMYCAGTTLRLSNNKLEGSLDYLTAPNCNLYELALSHNQFSGTFPNIRHSYFWKLDISRNQFTGGLPVLNPSMKFFSAAYNPFNDSNYEDFRRSVHNGSLTTLDLSGIGLSHKAFLDLTGPSLQYLFLANNSFRSTPQPFQYSQQPLVGLDLSYNGLSGSFSLYSYPSLVVLKLTGNQLQGQLKLSDIPSITQVEIEDNQFEFDVAEITNLPLLLRFRARNNKLFGALSLDDSVPNLESVDLSQNQLDQFPLFSSIGGLVQNSHLEVLNITCNPIPQFPGLDTKRTGLNRTLISFPSKDFPLTLTCYQLAFGNTSGTGFHYDENLFSYRQCDCNDRHFGSPPLRCFKCPTDGTSSCGGPQVTIKPGMFAYALHPRSNSNDTLNTNAGGEHHLDVNLMDHLWALFASPFTSGANPEELSASSSGIDSLELYTETCLVKLVQSLSGRSNCKGIQISKWSRLLQMQTRFRRLTVATRPRSSDLGCPKRLYFLYDGILAEKARSEREKLV